MTRWIGAALILPAVLAIAIAGWGVYAFSEEYGAVAGSLGDSVWC